jgi:hypothetical protein
LTLAQRISKILGKALSELLVLTSRLFLKFPNLMKSIKCCQCVLVNRDDAPRCLRCKNPIHPTNDVPQSASLIEAPIGWETTIERPFWVKVGLWGLSARAAVLGFFAFSILLAPGLTIYWSWLGAGFYLSGAWYWFSMRWVAKNDSW